MSSLDSGTSACGRGCGARIRLKKVVEEEAEMSVAAAVALSDESEAIDNVS